MFLMILFQMLKYVAVVYYLKTVSIRITWEQFSIITFFDIHSFPFPILEAFLRPISVSLLVTLYALFPLAFFSVSHF